jgi:trk system potassium uptake protein TrkA
VALFGGDRLGETIARVLLDREIGVSLIEADARRADELAAALPDARVYESTGFDPAFLRREHIGRASAAVFALRDDAANLFGAVVTKVHGVPSTIAVLERATAREAFDAAGVDAAIDPGAETAEVMVRFAHDPRTRQVAILEDDRFEVLDIAVRPQSPLAGRAFGDLTSTASMVGAVVRDGRLVFPSDDEALRVGDRVIVLAERERVGEIERAL